MSDIAVIAVLIIMSAFFSASETAFSSVNKIRLKNYAAQGDKRAAKALKIAENYDKALTAILIGNNIVNIAAASLATIVFSDYLGEGSVGIATVVMTVVVLIFGEIIPKSLAKENAEAFSLSISSFLSGLIFILTPVIAFFVGLKNLVTRLTRKSRIESPSVTEEELMYIIEEIEDQGVLEEQESDLVKSALEFDEITVGEILIPRVNVTAVEISQNMEEICQIFRNERYSRLPVYEKTIDSIVGILHHKDFFDIYIRGEDTIKGIVQKALYISEHKRISEVLHVMQKTKNHMAIVIDQYGGTEGILTLEDIIEELVGDIFDENDDEVASFEDVGESTFSVSGDLSISDLLEKLELDDDKIATECNSVGGWVMELMEHIPEKDESIAYGIFTITVLEISDQTVKRVLLKISDVQEQASENSKA